MWLDNASQQAVNVFWERCGETEVFPRTLESAALLALPIVIIKFPNLQLNRIESWLARRNTNFRFGCANRAVRGCLVAYAGKGLIFLDGTDLIDEQRFTLAHEISHFLIEYWMPRQRAIQKFGSTIAEVLDCLRPPTVGERVHSFLAGINLGVYSELMPRADSVESSQFDIWNAENRADRIATALLAPPENVIEKTDVSHSKYDDRLQAITKTLTEDFGLPAAVARLYGAALLTEVGKGRSFSEFFR